MTKTRRSPEELPFVENYPALREWLTKHRARCMWQMYEEERRSVEGWLVNARLVVLVVYPRREGWEIFTGVSSLDIAESLAEAEKALGLT